MSALQAFLLGIIQGLTEFLPISSSGHLELGHVLLNIGGHDNLLFAVAVHGATMLSTLVVFRKDIASLFFGLLAFKWNEETKYILMLVLSAVPVAIAGLFLRHQIEGLFSGNVMLIGSMLMVTAVLLAVTYFAKPRNASAKQAEETTAGASGLPGSSIRWIDALIIGLVQAIAVIPGISRSGSTIATGLLLGKRRDETARFSFLMVLLPILGANFIDLMKGEFTGENSIGAIPLMVGFMAAFFSGWAACRWMINIVKKGKLIYFSVYCLVIGLIAVFLA